jgi:hypothetical protein
MTIISTSYDALLVVIQAALTTWTRLVNPDDIQDNFDSFLREGWCLTIDDSINTNRNLCSISSWNRSFTLVMVVEYFGSNTSYTVQDDAIKKLIEASSSVARAIEIDDTLAVTGGKVIARVTNDSGIIPIETDTRKFISCSLSISIETFIGY